MRYWRRKITDLIPFISELRRNQKHKHEKVNEMGVRRENETMLAPSIPFLKCELYTQYTPLVGSANQCMPEIVHIKRVDRNRVLSLHTSETVLQILKIIRIRWVLK